MIKVGFVRVVRATLFMDRTHVDADCPRGSSRWLPPVRPAVVSRSAVACPRLIFVCDATSALRRAKRRPSITATTFELAGLRKRMPDVTAATGPLVTCARYLNQDSRY